MLPSAGGVVPNQPFRVRRRTNPLSPTSQAASALTKTPARTGRSVLYSFVHVVPPSVECSIARSRARHITRRFERRPPRRTTPPSACATLTGGLTSAGGGLSFTAAGCRRSATGGAGRLGEGAAAFGAGAGADAGSGLGAGTAAAGFSAAGLGTGGDGVAAGGAGCGRNAHVAIPATTITTRATPATRGRDHVEAATASCSLRKAMRMPAQRSQLPTCCSTAPTSRENSVPST